MIVLVSYLLQVIAASGLLYGYYHFMLRNNRFHQYNRFYLLAATVISITIPFLDIPFYFTAAEKESSFVLQTITAISPAGYEPSATPAAQPVAATSYFSFPSILVLSYGVIAILALVRTLLSLLQIRRIMKRYESEQLGSIRFVNTSEPGTPFSFFRWLFWNQDIELQSDKGQQVFRHEVYHIEQKHSLDLVYAELLTVICWINPFFHLIKKELRAIHEFLADRFAINENKKWEYAEMLLMQALDTKQPLINPFFQTHIKRRIAMITSSKKPAFQYARKLLVIPVAAIAVALFAFSYHEKKGDAKSRIEIAVAGRSADTVINPQKAGLWGSKPDEWVELKANHIWVSNKKNSRKVDLQKNMVVINGKITPVQEIYNKLIQADSIFIYKPDDPEAIALYGENARNGLIIFKNATLTAAVGVRASNQPATDAEKIFDKVEFAPTFNGEDAAWKKFLEKNLDASVPLDKKAPAGAYSVVIMFLVDKNGMISGIKPLTHHGYGMEQEAIRVISSSPAWNPANQNGRIVKAYHKQVITFIVTENSNNTTTAAAQAAIDNLTSSNVETAPSFPGGEAKFREYIALNQQQHSKALSASPFREAVAVEFIVKTDGSVNEVKAVQGTTPSAYTALAINLIKNGPHWVPALQNGKKVTAMKKQVVTFSAPAGKLPAPSQWADAASQKIPALSLEEFKHVTAYQLLQLENDAAIVSYTFSIDKDNGDLAEAENRGAVFSSQTRNLINTATAGKLVTIDRIIILVNGVQKKLASRVYRLVN